MISGLSGIILCDFDGTVSSEDICDRILASYGGNGWREIDASFENKEISFEEMNRRFVEGLTCTPEALESFISENIALRNGFLDFYDFVQQNNYGFIILSNGWSIYLQKALNEMPLFFVESLEDIDAPLLLNRGALPFMCNKVSARGSMFVFQPHALKSRMAAPDKLRVAQYLREKYSVPIIAIGNGTSDYGLARVADVVFATDGLLRYCEKEFIPFIGFDSFLDIKGHLKLMLSAGGSNISELMADN